MLKPALINVVVRFDAAATFGWLCVETANVNNYIAIKSAATFGWLCVETSSDLNSSILEVQPPSGGCVLKLNNIISPYIALNAATFGWLCVETRHLPTNTMA